MRDGKKVSKKRVYLGVNLSKSELEEKKKEVGGLLVPKRKENEALKKIIPTIKKILIRNHIKKAGIFGSYAAGNPKKNSDIDILIQPPRGTSLIGFVGIKLELEKNLKKKVDLLSYNGINPLLKKQILSREVKII
ncbi:MAG: nucleotidyltransferase domain-containing protein [Nanoarchaeota archaeon]|nr:nucleotidyltransferase domain-containing protein [Nanoarchaeota archaeon]